jgi:hypothetical protein
MQHHYGRWLILQRPLALGINRTDVPAVFDWSQRGYFCKLYWVGCKLRLDGQSTGASRAKKEYKNDHRDASLIYDALDCVGYFLI